MMDKKESKTPYLIRLFALPYVAFFGVCDEKEEGFFLYGKRSYRLYFPPAMRIFALLALIVPMGALLYAMIFLKDGMVPTSAGALPIGALFVVLGLLYLLLPLGMKGENLSIGDWSRLAKSPYLNSNEKWSAFKSRLFRSRGERVAIKKNGNDYSVVSGGWAQASLGWWMIFLGVQNIILSGFDTYESGSWHNFILRMLVMLVEGALMLLLDYHVMRLKVVHQK